MNITKSVWQFDKDAQKLKTNIEDALNKSDFSEIANFMSEYQTNIVDVIKKIEDADSKTQKHSFSKNGTIDKLKTTSEEIGNKLAELVNKRDEKEISELQTKVQNLDAEIVAATDFSKVSDFSNKYGDIINKFTAIDQSMKSLTFATIANTNTANFGTLDTSIKAAAQKLLDLKNRQVNAYNSQIASMKQGIADLKSKNPSNVANIDTVFAGIINATDIPVLTDASQSDYLTQMLSSSDLRDFSQKLQDMQLFEDISVKPDDVFYTVDDVSRLTKLEQKIKNLEKTIEGINTAIDNAPGADQVKDFRKQLFQAHYALIDISDYIGNNYKHLKGNGLLKNCERMIADVNEIRKKIDDRGKDVTKSDIKGKGYREFANRVLWFDKTATHFEYLIGKNANNANKKELNQFIGGLDSIIDELDEFINYVEQLNKDGKLEKNQYDNLISKCTGSRGLKERYQAISDKVIGPEFVSKSGAKGEKTFNDIINGLDANISELNDIEQRLNAVNGKMGFKESRENFGKALNDIEKKLIAANCDLKKYKKNSPHAYQRLKEKYGNACIKFQEVSKKYRGKCKLGVKAVRGTGNFFKKYKKTLLWAIGLTSFIVVSSPYLIPALMQAFIMIGAEAPSLAGVTFAFNKALASVVGAQFNGFLWTMPNGLVLNANAVGASLLRGIATIVGSVAVPGILVVGNAFREKASSTLIKRTSKLMLKANARSAKKTQHINKSKSKNNGSSIFNRQKITKQEKLIDEILENDGLEKLYETNKTLYDDYVKNFSGTGKPDSFEDYLTGLGLSAEDIDKIKVYQEAKKLKKTYDIQKNVDTSDFEDLLDSLSAGRKKGRGRRK